MSTYAETAAQLDAARAAGIAEITIEINEGVFTVPLAEAVESFDALAPGEYFEIVSAPAASVAAIAHMPTATLEILVDHHDGEISDTADAELTLREEASPHDEHIGLDLPTYAA